MVEQDYLSEAQSYLGDKVVYLDIPTNDAWARDTGPTILVNDEGQKLAVDWSFNAWEEPMMVCIKIMKQMTK